MWDAHGPLAQLREAMTWTLFIQALVLLHSGAWIYHCGKSGQSLIPKAKLPKLWTSRQNPEDNGSFTPPDLRA